MPVDFNFVWLGVGALIAIITPMVLITNFIKTWRKDIEAHTKKHEHVNFRVENVEKSVDAAHEKIRSLETMRQADHELIVKMAAAIEYIKESIDELKGRNK